MFYSRYSDSVFIVQPLRTYKNIDQGVPSGCILGLVLFLLRLYNVFVFIANYADSNTLRMFGEKKYYPEEARKSQKYITSIGIGSYSELLIILILVKAESQ